jgi:hypothetical protein
MKVGQTLTGQILAMRRQSWHVQAMASRECWAKRRFARFDERRPISADMPLSNLDPIPDLQMKEQISL